MTTKRPVQYFSDEYLAQCAEMTPDQICEFIEGFRKLASASTRTSSRLISMRVREPLLLAFRQKARARGVPYQTQIQRLMEAWLLGDDDTM